MKKITLLVWVALSVVSFSYAQTLKIISPGGTKALNDSTLTFYMASTDAFSFNLNVINTSATMDTVEVQRVAVSILSGSTNEVCWAGICAAINNNTDTIGPGDTAELGYEFSGDYSPNGYIGTTTLRYVFYDIGRPAKISDTITVNYISTLAGIAEVSGGQINFSKPYPDPANNVVNFNYSLANDVQIANIKVFNLLGECVQTLPISALENKATINVQSMASGIYVCEVQADGCQPVYQKLIVSH